MSKTESRQSVSPPPSKRPKVNWPVEDLSEYRPEVTDPIENMGKDQESFRVFNDVNDPRYEIVRKTYGEMYKNQTMDTVKSRMKKWTGFKQMKLGMMDAVILLDQIIDESDPDVSIPNSIHCFQTAERIRQKHPDEEWFHLTGLIHDAGKVLALWGEPQYAVVGDTFPVGCKFSEKCVHYDLFENNPDTKDEKYSTKFGVYEPNCGLDKVQMSFGHDEYLYRVLVKNKTTLPEEALYCIRYHSFYPWHACGDYMYLCNETDEKMLTWVKEFNKFDLYSKADELPKIEELKEYYQTLIDKYIPGELMW